MVGISPARRKFMATKAAKESALVVDTQIMAGSLHELMMAKLYEDKLRLKSIQSIESKIQYKKDNIQQYIPYLEGVLTADSGVDDLVFISLMVWALDVSDWSLAIKLGTYAIKHNLSMPDGYRRSTACVLLEEITDFILKQLALNQANIPAESDVEHLNAIIAITEKYDMPDEVRAKSHRAVGLMLRKEGEAKNDIKILALALNNFKRALTLNANVGVKKDIEQLSRLLNKAQKESSPDVDGTTASS
jgi:hypothetical protein